MTRGKGVIRDPLVHRQVLQDVLLSASELGYTPRGLLRSPLTGPKGNLEFLAWLGWAEGEGVAIEHLLEAVLPRLVGERAGLPVDD